MRKKTTAWRLDVTIECKDRKFIGVTCSRDQHINEEKVKEKLQRYPQLAKEIRERRPGYHVEIFSVVIGCMGKSVNRLRVHAARVLETYERKR